MQGFLQDLIAGQLFAFLLIFMRLGTAMMIMPVFGETFVNPQARLLFSLAFSFVLTPILAPLLPSIPSESVVMVTLLVSEMTIGFFIGTIMRIMVAALDTAGSIVSVQAGFSNAMIFNPVTAAQGSVVASVYSMLGVTLLMVTDMHHHMLASLVESYHLFPSSGVFPDSKSMLEAVAQTVGVAFKVGVQIAMPFIIVGTLIQIGFGLLSRLMPQLQIFFLAMPLQIYLSLIMLAVSLSAGMLFWLNAFEGAAVQPFAPR